MFKTAYLLAKIFTVIFLLVTAGVYYKTSKEVAPATACPPVLKAQWQQALNKAGDLFKKEASFISSAMDAAKKLGTEQETIKERLEALEKKEYALRNEREKKLEGNGKWIKNAEGQWESSWATDAEGEVIEKDFEIAMNEVEKQRQALQARNKAISRSEVEQMRKKLDYNKLVIEREQAQYEAFKIQFGNACFWACNTEKGLLSLPESYKGIMGYNLSGLGGPVNPSEDSQDEIDVIEAEGLSLDDTLLRNAKKHGEELQALAASTARALKARCKK